MLKQTIQQKLQQKLSPQQIQLIRLLELPTIELEERIKQELDENPALEESSREDELKEENLLGEDASLDESDISLGDYMTEDDIPEYKMKEIREKTERQDIPFSSSESLNEYLLDQLSLRNLTEKDMEIGQYIIGNLDDDGYLRRDLMAIADDMAFQLGENVDEPEIARVLEVVKELDPPGIAAESLQESLLIQLRRQKQTPITLLAIEILANSFDEFSKRHYDKILKTFDIDEFQLKEVIKVITSLVPKPGLLWESNIETVLNQIIPDFIVDNQNGELILSMNNRSVPELRINKEYANLFEDYTSNKANQTQEMKNTVQFVKQKLDSAQWFIEAIRQRQQTLQRTMEAIIKLQHDFFLSGDELMLKPMRMKDVAAITGYDISTISRVSNSKYVQTMFGVFSLKYFFSESVQNEQGEEISTREVKKIMQECVDSEDKQKPITDEELSNRLKEKGYIIARRTVAKYREQMNIPVARLRKEI